MAARTWYGRATANGIEMLNDHVMISIAILSVIVYMVASGRLHVGVSWAIILFVMIVCA